MKKRTHPIRLALLAICILLGSASATQPESGRLDIQEFVNAYCADCHDPDMKKGGLDLVSISSLEVPGHAAVWEKVITKLQTREMPPAGKKRPDEAGYDSILTRLETPLDAAAEQHPNPGRTETLRRLNRTEYQNAIRDLLALEIDATTLLPKEDSGHGFDNVTVGTLSPTLLDRYITAAEKISRLAVGTAQRIGGDTFRLPADLTQEEHAEGLPLGTRGGALLHYTFPEDAEYDIQIRLTRDRNDEVEGLHEKHELNVLIDRACVASFTVVPMKDKASAKIDAHLKARIAVKAGPHDVGVTFVKNPSELLETKRQPYAAHFNLHRHPRIGPAIYQVSINGPYDPKGPGDSPSRRAIFVAKPAKPAKPEQEEACAKKIFSNLARRAFRRPVSKADLEKPLAFYRQARQEGSFDDGIEAGLSAILVSPKFLFRVEEDPPGLAPGTAYRISDLELATRLSFFLWSSIPDDQLLDLANRGELHKPAVLEAQTRRLLADPRSESLVNNFAGQWLYLRNLDSFTPDLRLFPDFDDNLRQAFREETELFFENVIHEDHSARELLKADYTFVNERLARHYGIPHVYGSRFRRISTAGTERGGLLRNGSILTVTSYANRTSPVLRGKWVLENLIGTPPPPPLPNVPALKDNILSAKLSVRERLSLHRANPQCANCHKMIDPPGFALENFDAVGRWRTLEEGKPVDASGGLPDGTTFRGVDGLEKGLLEHPDIFVSTLTEKLLTFALGRGMETYDGPAVRKIVRQAKANDYRFSSIIVGITTSTPFTMRKSF